MVYEAAINQWCNQWVSQSPCHTHLRALSQNRNAPIFLTQAFLTDHLTCLLSPVPSGGSVLCLGGPLAPPSFRRLLCILQISSQMQHPLKSFLPSPRVSRTFPFCFPRSLCPFSIKDLIWVIVSLCWTVYPTWLTLSVTRTETCLLRQG